MPSHPCDQMYSRLDLAKEQLEVAIFLFLELKSYASALTLAGAAEEVIGAELNRRGQQHVLDWKYENVSDIHKRLHGEDLLRKTFIAEENYVRDALKHFDRTEEPNISCDLQNVSLWMIVRACENANRVGLMITRLDEFNNWFYEHVVGI